MKILHTSDWHLGHILYEHERNEEMQSFLKQLQNIIAEQHPDALVVCGDIFDRTTAPISARDMYVRALLNIHDANPTMQIVVAAGNHDGKSSLEVESLLWSRLNIKIIGQIERDPDGAVDYQRHIVPVNDAQGHPCGFIIAVPHIYEYSYPQTDNTETKEERQQAFFQKLLDETAAQNPHNLPVVLTAHLTMTGGNFAGHNFNDNIGGIDTVDQQQLGQGYDYLALGHIHNAQTITYHGQVARYCGTPIAVSFDEQGKHSISMVQLQGGVKPIIEEIEIHNPKPLLTIPAKPKLFNDAIHELAELPNHQKAYIRLNVLLDGPLPTNYITQILDTLDEKEAQYCCVKTSLPEQTKELNAEATEQYYTAETMPSAQDLANIFYQKMYHSPLNDELTQLLEEAIILAQQELENE